MALPFDFAALPPEVNTERLLSGPGPASTFATASAYADLAAQLGAAAANTEGAIASISGSWQGLSADKARTAFRNHATWLQEQAAVATHAAALVGQMATSAAAAQAEMAVVAIELAENKAERAALLATASTATTMAATGGPVGAVAGGMLLAATMPALALNEIHYMAIWGEAVAVMSGYAGAVVPALAELPKPMTAPPIVGGGAPAPDAHYTLSPDSTTAHRTTTNRPNIGDTGGNSHNTTGGGEHSTTDTHSGGGDESSGGTNDTSGPGDGPQGTDPTGTGPDSGLSDPTGGAEDALSGPGYDNGYSDNSYGGDPAGGQDGFYGTTPGSTTLAGLSGGVGSAVAFSMMRGGVASMPGAATGFRMPGNWNPAATRAFGATQSQPATTVPPRKGPPRGATAPKSRMRRRKDEERKSKSQVFVPGEPVEVPVLERAPVIGVIEYAGERRDEPAGEAQLAVGVIERVDDDVAIPAGSDRPR